MRCHVVILVENNSVPADRRVWQESQALVDAGFRVTVICPTGKGRDLESESQINGVRILRFPSPGTANGVAGFLREYAFSLWHMMTLTLKVRLDGTIHFLQGCNPPDFLFIIAIILKLFGKTRYVFDHHDLTPELFAVKFPGARSFSRWILRSVERVNFAVATGVVSTNESYRRIAIERGKVPEGSTVVVRNGPDLTRFNPRDPDSELRHGKQYLLAYLGIIGHQDGLDHLLRSIKILRDDFRRDDFFCLICGDGDALGDVKRLSRRLGIDDVVGFTGFVDDDFIQRSLSTADVCLAPEPLNPFNNASTMIKIAEYMAMKRPVVAFDLVETKRTAEEAAVYARPNDENEFARLIDRLLRDPNRRKRMGEIGRRRVEESLSWEHSRDALVAFYRSLWSRSMAP